MQSDVQMMAGGCGGQEMVMMEEGEGVFLLATHKKYSKPGGAPEDPKQTICTVPPPA